MRMTELPRLALSIQQPWAWLTVNGLKDVENRTWPTKVRGKVAIHAGLQVDRAGYAWVRRNFPQIKLPAIDALETGGIVGLVHIVDCVDQHDSPWFFGPKGFVFADHEPLPLVPCRGRLGFFVPEVR